MSAAGRTADDPFDLLGLEPRFDLTPAAVRAAHLSRAAAAHPDRAGSESEAARVSAALNAARETLADPERRASALLARLGGPGAGDDRSLPDGFLIEIMELRERVEADLSEDADAARAAWQDEAAARRRAMIDGAAALFARAETDPAALGELRRHLNAWRYIERLIEQLEPGYHHGSADGA